MWKWIGVACAVAAVGVYLEFVHDIRTPRAELVVAGVVGTNQQPRTERFQDAIGVTLVGGIGDAPFGVFPFRIGPNATPDSTRVSVLASAVQERFKGVLAPNAMEDFNDSGYAIENCRNFPAADLGLKIARPLRLGSTTLCTAVWKRTRPSRMLIGITMADGGFWIRPFGRSVCRTLARTWLGKAGQAGLSRPDFVQCMLVDRPASKNAVVTVVYQVRADGTLAMAPGGGAIVPQN